MASSLEDLNLPMSVICKIVKESLPDGVSVAKDAKSAIARAASVFVLYLTSRASENSVRNKRKTLNCEDIVAALAEIGMGDFIPQVSRTLETYKQLGYKPRATGASKRQSELAGGSKQDEYDEEEEADIGDDAEEQNVRDSGAPKAKRARTTSNAKRPIRRDRERERERERDRENNRQAEEEQDGESYSDAESGSVSGSGSQSGSRSGSASSSGDEADENRSASRSRSRSHSRSRSASGSSRS